MGGKNEEKEDFEVKRRRRRTCFGKKEEKEDHLHAGKFGNI